MPRVIITEESIRRKINEYSNFKAAGIDKIPNFWLKRITALHHHYVQVFTKIIRGEETTPDWLTTGKTNLLPKSNETQLPKKY